MKSQRTGEPGACGVPRAVRRVPGRSIFCSSRSDDSEDDLGNEFVAGEITSTAGEKTHEMGTITDGREKQETESGMLTGHDMDVARSRRDGGQSGRADLDIRGADRP